MYISVINFCWAFPEIIQIALLFSDKKIYLIGIISILYSKGNINNNLLVSKKYKKHAYGCHLLN